MPTTTAQATTTTAQATTAQATTTSVTGTDPLAYLEGIFSYDLDAMRASVELAAPGSPAHVYAAWQLALEEIQRDAGLGPTQPGQVRRIDQGSVEVCTDGCGAYSGFTSDAGLLVTFLIDGSVIDSRLAAAGQPVAVGPITATVEAAYRSVSRDTLYVLVTVSSTNDVNLNIYSSRYIDPAGRLVEAADAGGPIEVLAGTTGRFYVAFDRADVGGRMILTGSSADFRQSYELDLPVVAISAP